MKKLIFIFKVLLVFLTLIFLITFLSSSMGYSEKFIIDFLLETSFTPHQNIILYGEFNYVPLPVFLYAAIVISTTILWLSNRLIHSINPKLFGPNNLKNSLLMSALTVLFFLLMIQTISISKAWKKNIQRFSKKTEIEQFHGTKLQQSLIMADFCNKLTSGPHKAIFETDLDTTRDPGMMLHRSLAYYLYPIDIRGIHQGNPDLWIAFNKNEAIKYVPDGYKILGILDNRNMIAIKE